MRGHGITVGVIAVLVMYGRREWLRASRRGVGSRSANAAGSHIGAAARRAA